MGKHFTPHLIASGVIVLVAFCICLSPLMSGTGDYRVLVTSPRVASQDGALLPAETATDPVVPLFARLPDGNTFNLRKNTVRGARIPLPPPPPLAPPLPPIMPLPEAQ